MFNSFELGHLRWYLHWKIDTSFKYYLNSKSVTSQLVDKSGFKYYVAEPQLFV